MGMGVNVYFNEMVYDTPVQEFSFYSVVLIKNSKLRLKLSISNFPLDTECASSLFHIWIFYRKWTLMVT